MTHRYADAPSHFHKFFPRLTLPGLQSLIIKGFVLMDDLLPFLHRHQHLRMLQLKSNSGKRLIFPTQQRARLALESLSGLVISSEFVEPFFSRIDVPRLAYLHLHLKCTTSRTSYTALRSLSSYDNLHAVSLCVSFDSHPSLCLPHPEPLYPPMLLGLTRLQLEFRDPIYDDVSFVSSLVFIGIHDKSDQTV